MQAVKQYLASIGAKGGKAKSRAKLAAARANGKNGGRPKKLRAVRKNLKLAAKSK